MIAHLPSLDSHLNVWKDIVTMHSAPLIQVERVFLTEFLKLFIIPALEKSQTNDEEMGLDAGYLARLWPFTVRSHILSIKSYQEFPEKFFPATEATWGILSKMWIMLISSEIISRPHSSRKLQLLLPNMGVAGLNSQSFCSRC